MSVNILPFSLDRSVSRLEDQSVDKDLHLQPDQPGSVSFVAYGPTRIFVSIFSSLISGNEVSLTLIINDGTLE